MRALLVVAIGAGVAALLAVLAGAPALAADAAAIAVLLGTILAGGLDDLRIGRGRGVVVGRTARDQQAQTGNDRPDQLGRA